MYLLAVVALSQPALDAASRSGARDDVSQPQAIYRLYSWRTESGKEWNFSILEAWTSSYKSPSQVLDPKHRIVGLKGLERALDALPDGSEVLWIDGLFGRRLDPKTGHLVLGDRIEGAEQLAFPPTTVMDRVRVLAREYKVDLLIPKDRDR